MTMNKFCRLTFGVFMVFMAIVTSQKCDAQGDDFYVTHIRKSETKQINRIFSSDSCFKRDSLMDLSLIYFPNDTSKKDCFVIIVPGDGGWAGFIVKWAADLQKSGYAVIGFNTVPYFVKEQTPQSFSADLARVITNFSHALKKKKVILGGYSYGAELLPFAYNCFDSLNKKNVEKLLLVGPTNSASFKVSPDYIYTHYPMKPVLPELQKIEAEKIFLFCDDSKEALCHLISDQDKYSVTWLHAGHLFLGKEHIVTSVIGTRMDAK